MDQMNLAAAGPALGSNASYIEKLYARWKESPGAVAEAWQITSGSAREAITLIA